MWQEPFSVDKDLGWGLLWQDLVSEEGAFVRQVLYCATSVLIFKCGSRPWADHVKKAEVRCNKKASLRDHADAGLLHKRWGPRSVPKWVRACEGGLVVIGEEKRSAEPATEVFVSCMSSVTKLSSFLMWILVCSRGERKLVSQFLCLKEKVNRSRGKKRAGIYVDI